MVQKTEYNSKIKYIGPFFFTSDMEDERALQEKIVKIFFNRCKKVIALYYKKMVSIP